MNAYANAIDWIVRAVANGLAVLGGLAVFVAAAIMTLLFPLPAIALLVLTGVSVMVVNSISKGN